MAVRRSNNGTTAVVERSVDVNPMANDLSVFEPVQTVLKVTMEGICPMLFHNYDCASVEGKTNAAKGSTAKKTDDVESYKYLDSEGYLCVPGEVVQGCLAKSAKSFQDPRSPRKSAMELFEAGILVLPDMIRLYKADGSLYKKEEFLDRRRVVVQQSAVSRIRPGIHQGWRLDADVTIMVPQISIELFQRVLANGGATCGLCDFRPRYGRFRVVRCDFADLE